MRDKYYKYEPHKLEMNHFSQYHVHSMIYSALFSLSLSTAFRGLVVSVLDSYFGDRGFESQSNLLLCSFYFYFFYSWILFLESFRYILKLILNHYFKFERNLS